MSEVHVQGFNFASSAWHVCIFTSHFLPSVFLTIYPKIFSKNFYYVVIVIEDRNGFLMWFVIWFFMFFGRAETVHDNHQSVYWEHVVHMDGTCQYGFILEIVICNSSVTLFVLWFQFSCVLSICSSMDEKHFLPNLWFFQHVQKLHT